jgi:hypothetical protein
MRRFHNEISLLQRRLRLDRDKHRNPITNEITHCNCALGTFRKKRPLDKCGNKQCSICGLTRIGKRLRVRRVRRQLRNAESHFDYPNLRNDY